MKPARSYAASITPGAPRLNGPGCPGAGAGRARRGFLRDDEGEWIDAVRHELEVLYVRALECYAQASLGIGGTELAAAERAGRELVALAPYRESGYRQLMTALARTGNTAEALRVFEALRGRLRDELGVAPSAETLELHAGLLRPV